MDPRETYTWVDPANPRGGYVSVRLPKSREGALALVSHLEKQEDREAMARAFDEGYRTGSMRQGLEFMRDAAAEWRQNGYVPPAKH